MPEPIIPEPEVEELAPEDVEEVIDTPPADKPPKQTAQERIDEITYKRREAEREAEYWKNVALGEAEPPVIDKVDEPPATPPKDDTRPKQANYGTAEEYEDALFDWRDGKQADQQQKTAKMVEMQERLKGYNARAEAFRAANPDFDKVIEAPVFTDTMRELLLDIENGPMITYHIAKNPEIADKIKVLPPNSQVYAIHKLENELLIAQEEKPTAAPEPITPVGATGATDVDPSKMNIDEWMEWDKKRSIEKITKKVEGG